MVGDIADLVQDLGQLDNTYFIYTADHGTARTEDKGPFVPVHGCVRALTFEIAPTGTPALGFHLGEFNMPYFKGQPYETDLRVPFMIRGPGESALYDGKDKRVCSMCCHRPLIPLPYSKASPRERFWTITSPMWTLRLPLLSWLVCSASF
jgi:arylsulfatase A-like enzyme